MHRLEHKYVGAGPGNGFPGLFNHNNNAAGNSSKLDPIIFQVSKLLNGPQGIHFLQSDKGLNEEQQRTQFAYISALIVDAIQSMQAYLGFTLCTHSAPARDEDCLRGMVYTQVENGQLTYTVGDFLGAKNHVRDATLSRKELELQLIMDEFKITEPLSLASDGTLAECKLESPLKETITQRLAEITTFTGCDEKQIQEWTPALLKIMTRRGHIVNPKHFFNSLDLTENLDFVKLNGNEFTGCLNKSRWNNELNHRYARKLFFLFTGLGQTDQITLRQYIQSILWLGDPQLTPEQAIPAKHAIDFYLLLLTKHETAKKLFRPQMTQLQYDALTEKDKKEMGPIVRFNEGRVSFDKNKLVHFHRNLVMTSIPTRDKDVRIQFLITGNNVHHSMFAYFPKENVIRETNEGWKIIEGIARKAQRYRYIITTFNTRLRDLPGMHAFCMGSRETIGAPISLFFKNSMADNTNMLGLISQFTGFTIALPERDSTPAATL